MESSLYDLKRKELERIFHQQPQSPTNQLALVPKFSKLLAQIFTFLTKDPEPRIGKVKDSMGNTVWCVYDPISGQSARLTSETEVRVWLESRYYTMP